MVVVPPSSQHVSNMTKRNRFANECRKKRRARAKARSSVIQKYVSSLDTTMYDVLEKVVVDNKLLDSDDSIHILDPILINLDEEDMHGDTDDVNDEYETIDIEIDLHNILSSLLTITPSTNIMILKTIQSRAGCKIF